VQIGGGVVFLIGEFPLFNEACGGVIYSNAPKWVVVCKFSYVGALVGYDAGTGKVI
jgi:hypothetical protein